MYQVADMNLWQGRVDQPVCEDNRRWHQVMQALDLNAVPTAGRSLPSALALLGFACDVGVKRNQGQAGAHQGPDYLRQSLAKLAYHGTLPMVDAGNVECGDENLEQAQYAFSQRVGQLLKLGQRPLLMGGGHEIAFASFGGLYHYLKSKPQSDLEGIGIINFDAHFDLRKNPQATSGTPFLQIAQLLENEDKPFSYLCLGIAQASNTQALFKTAESLNVQFIYDWQMNWANWESLAHQFTEFVKNCRHLYITIDLDAFAVSLAPGVSAPAAGGIGLDLVASLLMLLKQPISQRAVSLELVDVAELNPGLDRDRKTAMLAARLMFILASLMEIG